MAPVVRSPFFVPRPSDDTYWSGSPDPSGVIQILTQKKIFGAGGQVPTKNWNSAYTLDDHASYQEFIWVNHTAQLVLTEAKFFGKNGQVPTKNWKPAYTLDDHSSWFFPWTIKNFGIKLLTPPSTLITRSPFFVPRPSDGADIWQGTPTPSLKLSPVSGQINSYRWLFGYDDSSYWVGKSNAKVTIPVAAGTPVKKRSWLFDQNTGESFWNASPTANLFINYLPSQNLFGAVFQVPDDADDHSSWWLSVYRNIVKLSASQANPFIPISWKFNYDDHAVWKQPSQRSIALPFVPSINNRRRLDAADDLSWSMTQQRDLLLIATPFVSLINNSWRHNIDDAVWWNWTNKNIAKDLQVNKPLTIPAQQFVISAEEPWTLTTQRNLQTDSVVLPPFKAKQWHWDNDDSSMWSGWTDRNLVNITTAFVPPNPLVPVFYRFHADDQAIWQQPPQRSIGLPFVPPIVDHWRMDIPDDQPWSLSIQQRSIGLPFVPIINNRWQLTTADDTSWSFTLRQNQTLSTPTQFSFLRWRSDIDEYALWQKITFRSIALPTVPAINNRYFRYIPDDQPWTSLYHRNIGAMITVAAPPPPFTSRQPSFAFDDKSSYQWPMKSSIILSLKWNTHLERIGDTVVERRIVVASFELHISTTKHETRIAIAPDEDL